MSECEGRAVEADGSDRLIARGCAVPAERMIRRERLLSDLKAQGEKAGITLIVAPSGFGKTTLLIQRVAEVRASLERGRRVCSIWRDSTALRRIHR